MILIESSGVYVYDRVLPMKLITVLQHGILCAKRKKLAFLTRFELRY